jgi:hypothetical protein
LWDNDSIEIKCKIDAKILKINTLLIAAAALAAGIISSRAQPVFPQNIVGYVNVPQTLNIDDFALPLDLPAGNAATNVFQNVYNPSLGFGPLGGDLLYLWNGTTFVEYVFDSLKATGFGTRDDLNSPNPGPGVPGPTLSPGQAVFIDNVNLPYTNTIVGTVHVDVAATGPQVVGTTTNIIPLNLQFISSKLPVAGGISSVLNMTNIYDPAQGFGPLDGNIVYVPNIAPGGFTGYTEYVFDSLKSTGFGDKTDYNSPQADGTALPEPIIPVGGGFFMDNVNAVFTWAQSL